MFKKAEEAKAAAASNNSESVPRASTSSARPGANISSTLSIVRYQKSSQQHPPEMLSQQLLRLGNTSFDFFGEGKALVPQQPGDTESRYNFFGGQERAVVQSRQPRLDRAVVPWRQPVGEYKFSNMLEQFSFQPRRSEARTSEAPAATSGRPRQPTAVHQPKQSPASEFSLEVFEKESLEDKKKILQREYKQKQRAKQNEEEKKAFRDLDSRRRALVRRNEGRLCSEAAVKALARSKETASEALSRREVNTALRVNLRPQETSFQSQAHREGDAAALACPKDGDPRVVHYEIRSCIETRFISSQEATFVVLDRSHSVQQPVHLPNQHTISVNCLEEATTKPNVQMSPQMRQIFALICIFLLCTLCIYLTFHILNT